jgi:hypothetical protein
MDVPGTGFTDVQIPAAVSVDAVEVHLGHVVDPEHPPALLEDPGPVLAPDRVDQPLGQLPIGEDPVGVARHGHDPGVAVAGGHLERV